MHFCYSKPKRNHTVYLEIHFPMCLAWCDFLWGWKIFETGDCVVDITRNLVTPTTGIKLSSWQEAFFFFEKVCASLWMHKYISFYIVLSFTWDIRDCSTFLCQSWSICLYCTEPYVIVTQLSEDDFYSTQWHFQVRNMNVFIFRIPSSFKIWC